MSKSLPCKQALSNACFFYADKLSDIAPKFVELGVYNKRIYDSEISQLRELSKCFDECESFSLSFTYPEDKNE